MSELLYCLPHPGSWHSWHGLWNRLWSFGHWDNKTTWLLVVNLKKFWIYIFENSSKIKALHKYYRQSGGDHALIEASSNRNENICNLYNWNKVITFLQDWQRQRQTTVVVCDVKWFMYISKITTWLNRWRHDHLFYTCTCVLTLIGKPACIVVHWYVQVFLNLTCCE